MGAAGSRRCRWRSGCCLANADGVGLPRHDAAVVADVDVVAPGGETSTSVVADTDVVAPRGVEERVESQGGVVAPPGVLLVSAANPTAVLSLAPGVVVEGVTSNCDVVAPGGVLVERVVSDGSVAGAVVFA